LGRLAASWGAFMVYLLGWGCGISESPRHSPHKDSRGQGSKAMCVATCRDSINADGRFGNHFAPLFNLVRSVLGERLGGVLRIRKQADAVIGHRLAP
jgi:hypothetical protein